ncbi:hypothetical protein FSP39_002234 [Pinctada imbricata]|uniref:Uncharacterized protein n=1 Tax=Pinctada imbricata TaxID=66713 RepID=A0AA88Y1M2_PINIB|nr:hypothetical protein FSP39_002234 [Pinctada imbricata]
MEMETGELALSVHDLYPTTVNTVGPITTFVLEGTKMKTPEVKNLGDFMPRHMSSYAGRTRTNLEDGEFNINPEPVPYQPQNFMSSTLLKKVPIPKRHLDSFGGYEYTLGSKRGVILHTDRYQWDAVKSLEGMSQRDRLRAELEYMERLRGIKRRREMLPHRAQLDLLMGGKKVEFSERFDIQREIQKLKSLIMPQNARDLFHGRGFQLPDQHSSLKPRKQPSLDYDSDEDISLSANLQRFPRTVVDPDTGLSKARPFHQQSHLPRINNKNPLEKKGRRPIEVKLHDLVQSRRPGRFSEDGPWTPNLIRQGTLISHFPRL